VSKRAISGALKGEGKRFLHGDLIYKAYILSDILYSGSVHYTLPEYII